MKTLICSLTGVLLLTANLTVNAAVVTIPAGSASLNTANANSDGTEFSNGPFPFNGSYMLGNVNNLGPTGMRVLAKYDLSSLSGLTVVEGKLNFSLEGGSAINPPTHTIGIVALNYDAGSSAFTATDITTASTISVTTFSTPAYGSPAIAYSIDITAALTVALANGWDYVSFRLNDITAESFVSPDYGPSQQYVTVFPSLAVTAIPEPSLAASGLLAALSLAWVSKRRKLKANS